MAAAETRFAFTRCFAVFVLAMIGLIDIAHAQSARIVGPPTFSVGDTWEYRIYQVSTGKLNRTRVEVVTEVKKDSARIRTTDSTGEPPEEETITIHEMFNWPLSVGKSWKQPIIKDGKKIGDIKYVVQGWEVVSTSAGSFETLRLENSFTRPEGLFRQVIWYAPAARKFVRLYYLDKNGNPDQATELTRFKLQ